MDKTEFRKAYRAARLLHHTYACMAASKKCSDAALSAAFRCRLAHVWRGGVECAKGACRSGYSFRKAISIHLRAVKHRRSTGHRPATRFAA